MVLAVELDTRLIRVSVPDALARLGVPVGTHVTHLPDFPGWVSRTNVERMTEAMDTQAVVTYDLGILSTVTAIPSSSGLLAVVRLHPLGHRLMTARRVAHLVAAALGPEELSLLRRASRHQILEALRAELARPLAPVAPGPPSDGLSLPLGARMPP